MLASVQSSVIVQIQIEIPRILQQWRLASHTPKKTVRHISLAEVTHHLPLAEDLCRALSICSPFLRPAEEKTEKITRNTRISVLLSCSEVVGKCVLDREHWFRGYSLFLIWVFLMQKCKLSSQSLDTCASAYISQARWLPHRIISEGIILV